MNAATCARAPLQNWSVMADGIMQGSHLIVLSCSSVNLVQLNLPPLLRQECRSCFVSGSYMAFLAHPSHFVAFLFRAILS